MEEDLRNLWESINGIQKIEKSGKRWSGEDLGRYQQGKENYYKKGLEDIPDDWNEIEIIEERIKSDSFIDFLKSQGINTKGWKKVMEKWAAPDGKMYQRHYWTNGSDFYYHDGVIEFFPH